MKIWYIKECSYNGNILEKMLLSVRSLFKVIKVASEGNKQFCFLPIHDISNVSNRRIKKISHKLNKILYENDVSNIVISNTLTTNEVFKNELYSNNINILDGRKLFKFLSNDVINYVLRSQRIKIEKAEITILTNENINENYEIIRDIANRVGSISIITNHQEKFNPLEIELYTDLGIAIRISNNFKKSLLNAKVILNLDFSEEQLNKYIINSNAIIINTLRKINIVSKSFSGININYFQCKIPNEYKQENFCNEIMYEAKIYELKEYNKIREEIKEDKIKILNFVGNNGTIPNSEFIGKFIGN